MLRFVTSRPRVFSHSTTSSSTVATAATSALTTSTETRASSSSTSRTNLFEQEQNKNTTTTTRSVSSVTNNNKNSNNNSSSSNSINNISSSSSCNIISTIPTTSFRFYSSSSSSMKSNDVKDEEELVRVLGSQPKHVARRVRQMMATSRRRLSHFRNTVTYLMIVLQGKLQKGEIEPKDAAIVVEGILQECVELGQSDMAHLLFRAALRFRKFGVPVSPKCVHSLYGSFRESVNNVSSSGGGSGDGNNSSSGGGSSSDSSRRGLLGQLALEMKDQDDLKALAIAAFIYAGQLGDAQRLHNSIPSSKLTHDDFVTMIQAYAATRKYNEVEELVTDASKITLESFDHAVVYSAAISSCSAVSNSNVHYFTPQRNKGMNETNENEGEGDSSSTNKNNNNKKQRRPNRRTSNQEVFIDPEASRLQEAFLTECLQNACVPSDAAIASVMRSRLALVNSLEEAIQVESDLRQQLKITAESGGSGLGMAATTAFVLRCADFFSQSYKSIDVAMETKIEQLSQIVDLAIENGDTEQIDHHYAIALVRGFGALGHFSRMMESIKKLRDNTVIVDFKVYDEALRWLALGGNVKYMLELKSDMEKDQVYHSSHTYCSLLRGLGRFYPRLTHKFIEEARQSLPFFDEKMYGQLIASYGALGETESVKQIYAEMLDRDSRGRRPFNPFSVAQLLWQLASSDVRLFDEIVQLANRRGFFSNPIVQRAVIAGFATQRRPNDLNLFISQLPRKSFQIYISLLNAYGRLDDTAGFDRLLEEMKAASIPFNDTFFSIAAEICARWKDTGRFKRMVEISKSVTDAARKNVSSSQNNDNTNSSSFTMSATSKDPRILARLAHAHSLMNDWETVSNIWRDIKSNSDASIPMAVFNRFLEMCVRRNDLNFAHDVLEVMMTRVPPNPVTTTTVMDMLARMGRLHEVEVLLDEMCRTKNVQPTLVTFHHALTAFAKVGDVAKLVALRERLRSLGLKENNVTHNIILSGYGRAQRFESIPELLNERAAYGIPLDTNCYEILLDIYAKARLGNELEKTVQAILARTGGGEGENNSSSSNEINNNPHDENISSSGGSSSGSSVGEDREREEALFGTAGAESPLTPRLLASIATAYSHLGDVEKVEKFINMLLAHPRCRQTNIETVFLIYHRLRDNSKLDQLLLKYGGSEFILNICISAFAKAGMYDRVASILEELSKKKFALHTNTAVVLSSLLLKAGKVELAQTVLKFRRVHAAEYMNRDGGASIKE